MAENYVIWFENLRMTDVERVGGKNASLGEMISQLTEKAYAFPVVLRPLPKPIALSWLTMV